MLRVYLHFFRMMTVTLIMLVLFTLIISGVTQRSLSNHEAVTLWRVDDTMRDPETLRETARFFRDSLLNTWQNSQSEGIPQTLYYLTFDAWTLLLGVSEFSIRLLSIFVSMLILAVIYAAGRKLSNFRMGLILLIMVGLSGVIINSMRPRPNWREISLQADAVRSLNQPALILINEQHPLIYYANRGLLDGISMNIGWRDFMPQEISALANTFDNRQQVWAMTDMTAPQSWDAVAALSANRGVAYRNAQEGIILYQFDKRATDALSFTFSDGDEPLLAYRSNFYTVYEASATQEICIPLELESLIDISDSYTMQIDLLDMNDIAISQVAETLQVHSIGTRYTEEHCLDIPETGNYRLRLSISDAQDQPLSVLESEYFWGNFMIIGTLIR